MVNTKEEIEKRIKQLKTEITMGNYYDGWTLKGVKKELTILKDKLDRIIKRKKND